MSSSITGKLLCIVCNKNEAFFTCCGCRRDFCEDHINEHSSPSRKQSDDFLEDHRQLQQMTDQYFKQPNQHPLIEQIDKWEQQSIGKIQLAARDARTQVSYVIKDHIVSIRKSLEILTKNLEEMRNDGATNEIYSAQWREKLEKLRNDLIAPETIKLRKDDDEIAFISKLVVIIVEPNDLFERPAGSLRVEDHGHTIIHGQWSDHSSVRGKAEYLDGQYRLRFKLEQLDPDKWAFLGIVSKNAPISAVSISTPTVYGFAGQDGLCLNGVYQNQNQIGYKSDMEMNDTLELLIDCDQRIIRLTNERTHSSHELKIDIHRCPFPWQLILGLCCSAGDCIRILPCTHTD